MSLESRIKMILEGKADAVSEEDLQEKEVIKTKGGTTIEDSDDDNEEKDEKNDDEDAEEGEDEDDEDGNTDVSKDEGPSPKKDTAEVKEDFNVATPGQSKKVNIGSDNGNANAGSIAKSKTSKIKAKQSNRDDADEAGGPKLKDTASADAQDDAGKTAKITSGQKNAEGKKTEADGVTKIEGDTDINGFGKTNQIFGVKEHMEALFSGENLSEEFRSKAQTIFETAVEHLAEARFAEIQEEYQQQLDEAVEGVKSELVEQIDGYLDVVVEQWVQDNAVALESGIKSEVVESFIDGLKVLFKEHYVDIPEDAINVVEAQAERLESLELALEELQDTNEQLVKESVSIKRQAKITAVSGDLTETQKDKFNALAEKVEYTSDEEFVAKLKTIKESYFPVGNSGSPIPKDDTSVGEGKPSSVDKYVKALGGNLKFVR